MAKYFVSYSYVKGVPSDLEQGFDNVVMNIDLDINSEKAIKNLEFEIWKDTAYSDVKVMYFKKLK